MRYNHDVKNSRYGLFANVIKLTPAILKSDSPGCTLYTGPSERIDELASSEFGLSMVGFALYSKGQFEVLRRNFPTSCIEEPY